MAINQDLNNISRSIPEDSEEPWPGLTAVIVDICKLLNPSTALVSNNMVPLLEATASTLSAGGTLSRTTALHRIKGNGAPVTLSLTTAIADGNRDGEVLTLVGDDATNTVAIPDSANTSLKSDRVTLKEDDSLVLKWDSAGSAWVEIGRALASGWTEYNAEDWGAVGDGATDNSAAVNALIDAIGVGGRGIGRIIFFPRGHYLFNSTLDFTTITTGAIVIRGEGHTTTVLDATSSLTGTFMDFQYSATFNNLTIEEISIGGSKTAGQILVNCTDVHNATFRSMQLGDAPTLLKWTEGGNCHILDAILNFNDNNLAGSIALDLNSPANMWVADSFFLAEPTNPTDLECVNIEGSAGTYRNFFMANCRLLGQWKYGIHTTATADLSHLILNGNSMYQDNSGGPLMGLLRMESSASNTLLAASTNIVHRHGTGNTGSDGFFVGGTGTVLEATFAGNIIYGFEDEYDCAGCAEYTVMKPDGLEFRGDTRLYRIDPTDIGTTEDFQATGGYRSFIDGWMIDNPPISQTDQPMDRYSTGGDTHLRRIYMVRAGSITGIRVSCSTTVSDGQFTADVRVNGTKKAQVVMGQGQSTSGLTQSKDTDAFSSGDYIDVIYSTDANWTETTSTVSVTVEVET